MIRHLFGTDGIRGRAGDYPLDPLTVHAAGCALGAWSARHSPHPEVVIGMDTRESGPSLAEQVAGGLAHHGVKARFAGLITTPGVAYLTRTGPFVAGVMISASHNPYHDNGIKVFDHSGYKIPDAQEHLLEGEIFRLLESPLAARPASLAVEESLDSEYLDSLAATMKASLAGVHLVIDCAHGAASRLAPALFARLGARVDSIACSPDGRNINQDCGALHIDGLRSRVIETGADLGVAFDGDADRAIFVSHSGKIVDGDHVLLLAATHRLAHRRLHSGNGSPVVVATVMSNLGLEQALARLGVRLLRAPVGDRYVLEEMRRCGAVLGGEQSGHVIFLDYTTTGDGLLTALRVLEVMGETGKDLDALAGGMESYPQLLLNVPVRQKKPLAELPAVGAEIRAVEDALGSNGRVLVRFSGTELLARVMVEAGSREQVEEYAHRIAAVIRRELGAD